MNNVLMNKCVFSNVRFVLLSMFSRENRDCKSLEGN
jgi:hypothetical protein